MTTNTFSGPDLEVSFEFFPPATPKGEATLADCVERLSPLGPAFMSITYGAGGSTQDRTISAITSITASTERPVAGHLTCVGATKEQVHDVVDTYRAAGVSRIVALRGDAPADSEDGTVDGGYQSAADLVVGLRSRPDGDQLDISVAAYPEVHPRAQSAAADLDNLKRKVDAGADRVLTQFFFDNERFLRFRDEVERAKIDVPLVPGIMPVTNFAKISTFAGRCGAIIPDAMAELLADLDETPDVQRLVAASLTADQCKQLVAEGVSRFHFYTMNQPVLTAATCRLLGVGSTAACEQAPVGSVA